MVHSSKGNVNEVRLHFKMWPLDVAISSFPGVAHLASKEKPKYLACDTLDLDCRQLTCSRPAGT